MIAAVPVPMTTRDVMVVSAVTGDGIAEQACSGDANHRRTGINGLNWSSPGVVGGHASRASRENQGGEQQLWLQETTSEAINALHEGYDETRPGLFMIDPLNASDFVESSLPNLQPLFGARLRNLGLDRIVGSKRDLYPLLPSCSVMDANRLYWRPLARPLRTILRVGDVAPLHDHYALLWPKTSRASGHAFSQNAPDLACAGLPQVHELSRITATKLP
jgi:hypothetical protein